MCFFVAIGVKTNGLELVEKAMKPDLVSSPVRNSDLNCCLPKGYSFCWLISKGCSCDLIPESPLKRDDLEKKYEKRGWSKEKIRRVVFEKKMSITKKSKTLQFESLLNEIIIFSNPLYVFFRWFYGEIDNEKIEIIKNIEIYFEEFTIMEIRKYEDCLLKIQRK